MGLSITAENGAAVFRFDGDLTIFQMAGYGPRLTDACEGLSHAEIDLSAVDELDTAGIQLLAAIQRTLAATGGTAVVVDASPFVDRTLQLFGMNDIRRQVTEAGTDD